MELVPVVLHMLEHFVPSAAEARRKRNTKRERNDLEATLLRCNEGKKASLSQSHDIDLILNND